MCLVTVLIPTYKHEDTLYYAIKSIQYQTIQDFELLVVGDGQTPRTDEIMSELCAADSRISFFPNPKGAGNGELHRHAALQQAKGKFVCYLGDDDMWFPNHLEIMCQYLEKKDFVHTYHLACHLSGKVDILFDSLEEERTQWRMLNKKYSFFGLGCGGHTMDAYRRLPYGWRPKPKGLFSDLHMWRQFIAQDWCRSYTIPRITTFKLPSDPRKTFTVSEKLAELEKWWQKMQEKTFQQELELEKERQLVVGNSKPNWYFQTAVTLEKHGALDLAEEAYSKVVALNPLKAVAWNSLGRISLQKGDFSNAEAYFKRAIECRSDNPHFLTHLGQLFFKKQLFEQAIGMFEQAISIKNSIPYLHEELGSTYLKTGNTTAAIKAFKNAIKLNNQNPNFYHKMALALEKLGHLEQALKEAKQAVFLNSDNSTFRNDLDRLKKKLQVV